MSEAVEALVLQTNGSEISLPISAIHISVSGRLFLFGLVTAAPWVSLLSRDKEATSVQYSCAA